MSEVFILSNASNMQHPKDPSSKKTVCFACFKCQSYPSDLLHEITETASTNCRHHLPLPPFSAAHSCHRSQGHKALQSFGPRRGPPRRSSWGNGDTFGATAWYNTPHDTSQNTSCRIKHFKCEDPYVYVPPSENHRLLSLWSLPSRRTPEVLPTHNHCSKWWDHGEELGKGTQ